MFLEIDADPVIDCLVFVFCFFDGISKLFELITGDGVKNRVRSCNVLFGADPAEFKTVSRVGKGRSTVPVGSILG